MSLKITLICSNLHTVFLFVQLSGTIGASFPPLLQYLNLGENRLTGAIDEMIEGLKRTRIYSLVLRGNQFQGTIPSAMADLTSNTLSSVDLQDNNLTGQMPCDASGRRHSIFVGKICCFLS